MIIIYLVDINVDIDMKQCLTAAAPIELERISGERNESESELARIDVARNWSLYNNTCARFE